ncbi:MULTISPECIES: thiol peroxidase [Clostridium]|uniref:thiol peroxidase n=1 Tax=Clostridium TaxID=1485 RepID=UPI00189D47EA|nr:MULTISPECIES: thiol peroxidase [Clostridium]MBS7129609.1 thiol peroxidase [Clostridium sp.]MDB2093374.1 thiol peroxidase [Clostridium paraputrificum]MDB2106760.1 thiol peroxidase [Clostridium paraputrificum]MDB2113473.1 thiol peroxidase [Clostridium paraputrificum]MDU2283106.1 thiol peroxidase [Clostridium sp.]
MKKITFKGTDITLEGNQLSVGDTLKSCILVGNDLNEVELTKTNGIRVILSVPSIDTPVCDTEVRRFNKEIESLPNAHCYTVSMDLPFAQARWCGAAGINRVTTLSDYKYRSFGDTTGTYIKELGLLTRASFVVDENNKVIFVEYLDEVANEPSYDKIISVVKNAI